MSSTTQPHPYDTRYKHNIRPSLRVQKRKPPDKRASKRKGKGSRRLDDRQVISQEPLEIVSDSPSPSPFSLGDNAASPLNANNNGEVVNYNDNDNDIDIDMEAEVEVEGVGEDEDVDADAGAGVDPEGDPETTMYEDNPQPVDYGHAPGPQDSPSPEPSPPENIHHHPDSDPDPDEPVYDNPEGVMADFPMPYYIYPALPVGGPAVEEYESPFDSAPHVNYAILDDANVMAQEFSPAVRSHTFDAELNQTFKTEVDPPCEALEGLEGLSSLILWDSVLSTSSLDMGTAHWPSPLLSDPFSSVSGLDMMGKTNGHVLGEFGLDHQHYSTSYPTLEKEEQDFSNTAEAMRMQALAPAGFGFQSLIGDQQWKDRTYEDDDVYGIDYVAIMMMMKDQMEADEEGGMANQEAARDEVMEGYEEGVLGRNQEEGMKVEKEEEEEEGEGEAKEEDQEGEAKEGEVMDPPLLLLRQQLLDERIRNPEPMWGPYRPSNETLASMQAHMRALENRLVLSRAGWSAKLLEELFGSHLLGGQWPPPPLPPPPPPPY